MRKKNMGQSKEYYDSILGIDCIYNRNNMGAIYKKYSSFISYSKHNNSNIKIKKIKKISKDNYFKKNYSYNDNNFYNFIHICFDM